MSIVFLSTQLSNKLYPRAAAVDLPPLSPQSCPSCLPAPPAPLDHTLARVHPHAPVRARAHIVLCAPLMRPVWRASPDSFLVLDGRRVLRNTHTRGTMVTVVEQVFHRSYLAGRVQHGGGVFFNTDERRAYRLQHLQHLCSRRSGVHSIHKHAHGACACVWCCTIANARHDLCSSE